MFILLAKQNCPAQRQSSRHNSRITLLSFAAELPKHTRINNNPIGLTVAFNYASLLRTQQPKHQEPVSVALDWQVARPPCPYQMLHSAGSDKRVPSDANSRRGSTLLAKVLVPTREVSLSRVRCVQPCYADIQVFTRLLLRFHPRLQ